jgi:hypothetical protein
MAFGPPWRKPWAGPKAMHRTPKCWKQLKFNFQVKFSDGRGHWLSLEAEKLLKLAQKRYFQSQIRLQPNHSLRKQLCIQ